MLAGFIPVENIANIGFTSFSNNLKERKYYFWKKNIQAETLFKESKRIKQWIWYVSL